MGIHWVEQLSTGVPIIDEQHKEIFTQFSRLSAAIQDGECKEAVEKLLHYLNEYSNSHFIEEESLMVSHNYDGLDEQREHHVCFKENISKLLDMLASNVPSKELAIRMDAVLIRYFINHIRKLDSKLGQFMANKAA